MQAMDLLVGSPNDVLERTLALPMAQRRALIPELKSVLRKSAEFIAISRNTFSSRDHDLARLASAALLVTIPAQDRLLNELWLGDTDIIERALLARTPAERATLASRMVDDHAGWLAVRQLVRSGDLEPIRTPEYLAGWFRWSRGWKAAPLADRLRAEPEALDELWDLLAIEGGGDTCFAGFDKFVSEPDKWSTALLSLCDSGNVDRERLLDLTLDILARDFSPFRAQWYSALHESLTPTEQERAAAQNRYARLCGSAVPRTVSFAVRALSLVDKAGSLDDEVALQHLPAAAAGRTATTAKLALRIATGIVRRRPDLTDAANEVFKAALAHESNEIRELAGARLDLPVAKPEPVTASVRAYPEPTPPPWARRRMLTAALDIPDSPAALAESFSLMLKYPAQADLFLAALDATHRLAGHDLAAPLAPLVKRAKALAADYPDPVGELITALVLGLAGHDGPLPKPSMVRWLRPLRHRVLGLLDGTAVAVSAATHQGGWLDPVVFVERIRQCPDASEDDVVDALLRLAPDTRAEALALAADLIGPHANAVRFALGQVFDATTAPAPGWVAFAAARARYPESASPAAALAGDPGEPVSWTLRVTDQRTHIDTHPPRSPLDTPWLGLLFGNKAFDVSTIPHLMAAAPYDVERVEAAVAQSLLDNSEVVSYSPEWAPLQVYLDRPMVPSDAGTTLVAVAASRPEVAQLGMDVAFSLLEANLLGPLRLGDAFATLGRALVPSRLAKVLQVLAMEHPTAVLSIVDRLLPALDRGHRGVFALLELAADLAERGAGIISPATRQWLAAFAGSSKAAKAASRLLR